MHIPAVCPFMFNCLHLICLVKKKCFFFFLIWRSLEEQTPGNKTLWTDHLFIIFVLCMYVFSWFAWFLLTTVIFSHLQCILVLSFPVKEQLMKLLDWSLEKCAAALTEVKWRSARLHWHADILKSTWAAWTFTKHWHMNLHSSVSENQPHDEMSD